MREISGHAVNRGHGPLMRMLLDEADHDTAIVSQGERYYNASDFPLLSFGITFFETCGNQDEPPSRLDVEHAWATARPRISQKKKIVIGATPARLTREYLAVLDGGLVHEVLHSLYTVRGHKIDLNRAHALLCDHWRRGLPYRDKLGLLKTLWNVYEDAMIERHGLARWPATRDKLERVHRDVWELEAPTRDRWSLVNHVTAYLRDVVEEWTEAAPLNEYDPRARFLVDVKLAEEVAASDKARDSYDTFALALRTLGKLWELGQLDADQLNGEMGDTPNDEMTDATEEAPSDAEGQGGSGFGNPMDADTDEEAPESDSDASEQSGEGEGSDNVTEGVSDAPADSDDSDDADGEPGAEGEDAAGFTQEMLDELRDATEAEILDTSDVLEERAREASTDIAETARRPRPIAPDADERPKIYRCAADTYTVTQLREELEPYVTALRAQLARYLRGERVSRRIRNLKQGRRLSNRSLTNLITQRCPKPYERRVARPALTTSVQIVLDESFSMSGEDATRMMMVLGMVLGGLRVPWSAIGFRYKTGFFCGLAESGEAGNQHRHHAVRSKYFTRRAPCEFPLYHDFEEGNDDYTLSKLLRPAPRGGTPLPAGVWEGLSRLRQRRERRRLLIVITDGQTDPLLSASVAHAEQFVLRMTEDALAEGIDVLFVGYGYDLDYMPAHAYVHVPSNYYDSRHNFAAWRHRNRYVMEAFADRVCGWLLQQIREGRAA